MATKLLQLGVLAATAALAGCGGGRDAARELPPRAEVQAGVKGQAKTCRAGERKPLGSPRAAYAAVVEREAVAYRRPGLGRIARFGPRNVNGVPTVFGIRAAILDAACKPAWYHVQLPLRPNGVTGYVRARDVWVGRVRTRIEVDLSERRVTLFRDGRKVLSTEAAIGSSATPTPTGTYYVNQRLIPADTDGPFGPGAIGVSAFSPVLTGWAQGGPIAIHGTNQPGSIGAAVSNGCIRVHNDVLRELFDETLAGTPVVIRE